MTSGLLLIVLIACAYFAAHAGIEWLARRYLVISGAEYLLLGVLLGPQVSGLVQAGVVESFAPFMTLAIGWAGALVGAQFHLPTLLRTRASMYRIAFAEATLTLVFVSGLMAVTFWCLFGSTVDDVWLPAVALGAVATASSSLGTMAVIRRYARRSVVLRQIELTNAIDALVAIIAFSLLFCIEHPAPQDVRAPTATEWAVISAAIGIVGGALFHLFVAREHDTDRLFIALSGAIILASGAAAYLRLSPLLPALLIGFMLVNTARDPQEIRGVLARVATPFYFVLLIFAGAAWRPSPHSAWGIAVVLLLVLRVAGKIGSARMAARMNGRVRVLGDNWGHALLGQGALAVAIALNYLLYDTTVLPNVVFTATLVSVLFTDFGSARLVQRVALDYTTRVTARFADASPAENR